IGLAFAEGDQLFENVALVSTNSRLLLFFFLLCKILLINRIQFIVEEQPPIGPLLHEGELSQMIEGCLGLARATAPNVNQPPEIEATPHDREICQLLAGRAAEVFGEIL